MFVEFGAVVNSAGHAVGSVRGGIDPFWNYFIVSASNGQQSQLMFRR